MEFMSIFFRDLFLTNQPINMGYSIFCGAIREVDDTAAFFYQPVSLRVTVPKHFRPSDFTKTSTFLSCRILEGGKCFSGYFLCGLAVVTKQAVEPFGRFLRN